MYCNSFLNNNNNNNNTKSHLHFPPLSNLFHTNAFSNASISFSLSLPLCLTLTA